MAFLQVEDLTKIYTNTNNPALNRTVLRGITFKIEKSDFSFLVGRSGSGKTTLFQLIAGVQSPNAGQVLFDDQPIRLFNRKKMLYYRRKLIGLLLQQPESNLIRSLTVGENIRFPMKILNEIPRTSQKKRVIEILNDLELKHFLNKKISKISGGERQKIAILVAIANNPSLLLCDEPTGELDYSNSINIIKTLKRLKKIYGTTVFMITHNSNLIFKSSHVLKIDKGLLVN